MKLPDSVERVIEQEVNKYNISTLKEYSKNLSDKYMTEKRTGKTLLSLEEEAIAYSVIRMPATYGAVTNSLKNTLENIDVEINSLLDIGAGTGAGSIAVSEMLDLKEIICVEREEAMRKLGQKIMSQGTSVQKNAKWINLDILKDEINEKADLVIVSYMINELKEDDRIRVLHKLIDCTNKILLIIEPGTPEGFSNIKQIRNEAINKGLEILAPCSSQGKCDLKEGDWCSSSVRVQRTKTHKILKNADVPYEDEKFSYISMSKIGGEKAYSRILRHPIVQGKMIKLKLCTNSGIEEVTVTKKYSELYKEVKKKKVGDSIDNKIDILLER